MVNLPEYKYESSIDITESTKTIVGVTFGHLYEQMYDDKRRAQLVEVVSKYTEEQLLDPSMESKVRVVVGITTLLTNAPELGNSQLKDGLLQMMLVMAQSGRGRASSQSFELGKTGAQNVMYGVMATLVNVRNSYDKQEITNSYDKQEINPEMLELAKFAKHYIPEEHELDDEDFADKRICTIANLGVTSALAKTESLNMRELIGRVMNAICKHAELRGLVVQHGGSKAPIPLALEGTDKGRVVAAQVSMSFLGSVFINIFNCVEFQALSRIGITQDPSITFPGQRSCDVVRSL